MPFGSADSNKERRKTSHVNENYRNFLKDAISEVVGIPLDEKQALAIQEIAYRAPLRFLMTMEEADFDQYGERTLSIPNVGKFRIMWTIPQGRRIGLVGAEGRYPRFKYYPAMNVEAEVEILNGVESEESRNAYTKVVELETAHVEQNTAKVLKLIKKKVMDMVASGEIVLDPKKAVTNNERIGSTVMDLLKMVMGEMSGSSPMATKLASIVAKAKEDNEDETSILEEDVSAPEESSNDADMYEDDADTSEPDEEDEAPVKSVKAPKKTVKKEVAPPVAQADLTVTVNADDVKEPVKKATTKKTAKKTEAPVVEASPLTDTVLVEDPALISAEDDEPSLLDIQHDTVAVPPIAPTPAPTDVATTVAKAIDEFDFDFNT